MSLSRKCGQLVDYDKEKASNVVNEHSRAAGKQVCCCMGETMVSDPQRHGASSKDHEEANTKIILHALDATADGAMEISIYSPKADSLVLAIRRYAEMCHKTTFVTGRGLNQRAIKLAPIVEGLCSAKTDAPPTFHAIIGADNTWQLFGKGEDYLLEGVSGDKKSYPECPC